MAYCVLVEDAFARPVPYGVLPYSDARQQIPFTEDRKREVLKVRPKFDSTAAFETCTGSMDILAVFGSAATDLCAKSAKDPCCCGRILFADFLTFGGYGKDAGDRERFLHTKNVTEFPDSAKNGNLGVVIPIGILTRTPNSGPSSSPGKKKIAAASPSPLGHLRGDLPGYSSSGG